MEASDIPSPVVQRRRLRTELRRARLDAGLTQDQVATAMEWSLSKLIRIENGSVSISANDLRAILAYYKITDEKRVSDLLAISRAARERSWWSSYSDSVSPRLLQLIEYETAAFIARNFQPLLIPGMLQTAEYARVTIGQLALPQAPAEQLNALFNVRMKRQELLRRADAPLQFFIMDEAVIRRIVGGEEVMRRQLQHVVEVSEMPQVTIEVIPFSAGLFPGLQSQFLIYEFSDAVDDDVLYLEDGRGNVLIRDDQDEVLSFREQFEQLRAGSLGPEGSVEFIRSVAEELK